MNLRLAAAHSMLIDRRDRFVIFAVAMRVEPALSALGQGPRVPCRSQGLESAPREGDQVLL